MKHLSILISLFSAFLLNGQTLEFEPPVYSRPAIFPASGLSPNNEQLNPNLIHIVILGDGYKVLNDDGTFSIQNNGLYTLNKFDNSNQVNNDGSEIYNQPIHQPGIYTGDSEDLIDQLIGDIDNGRSSTFPGASPYKEYKNYFRFYRVLYNSPNGNGIGHPYAENYISSQSNIPACDPSLSQIQNLNPAVSTSTFWQSEFDFCNAHRAIIADYNKIDNFLDVYFPGLREQEKVFVIVLSNYGGDVGGAANIKRGIASIIGGYSVNGIANSSGNLTYNHYDEQGGVHELSHVFAKLQDEYWFPYNANIPCFTDPEQLNISEEEYNTAPNRFYSDPAVTNWPNALLPWYHWNTAPVSNPPIGNFNHTNIDQCTAAYTTSEIKARKPIQGNESMGSTTPVNSCKMQNTFAPFCAVCREAIIERIHSLVSPINSSSPSTNNGNVIPISSSQNFEVSLTIPVRTDLSNNYASMVVNWSVLDETGSTVLATLHQEEPSITPVNPAAAIYTFTDPTHVSICDWFNGREAGNYQIKVEVYDRAGVSENLTDNTRWVRDPDHTAHKYSVTWNVHYSGIAGIDLYSSDSEQDLGSEPSYVADVNWESNDIWVTNSTNPNGLIHENPVYSTTASPYVHTWVKNRGCKVFDPAVDNANVKMYWSKATTMLDWPTSWDGSSTFPNVPNPITGNLINTVSLNDVVDIATPGGVKVDFTWANFPDPSTYDFFGVNDMLHFCLLSRIESTFDPMTNEVTGNTYFNVRNNNNIVQKNITVIDDQIIGGSTGDGFTDDRVTGASVLVSNSSALSQTVKFKFQVPNEEIGKPITEEAQVRIILSDTLWQRWIRGGSQGSGVSIYSASRHQIRLTSDDASLSNIQIDTAEFEPLYVSVNFLTQERSTKELFTLRVLHTLEDSSSTVLGGETYLIKPDPYRVNFSADAGNDKELLVGTAWNQNAKTLTETAIYNWYNSSGTKIHSGTTLSDTTSSVSSETYTLEVIAQSDGYKDYDEVTITSKLGKINSIVPNPINSGTFTIDYSVSTSASSPKIKVLNINTGAFTEHTISTGNGTLSLAISGYAAGSYSVILICNSQNADDELLIIQ